MDVTWQGYSAGAAPAAAQALRQGGADVLREVLLQARTRTLALADDYARALGHGYPDIPYAAALNPPLWEIGHVAWFQEYWISRNRQRALGWRCDPDHPRPASLLAQADACFDSGKVAHATRWSLPLPDDQGTRDYLARTLAQTLELLAALPPGATHDDLYFFRLVALHELMHAEAGVYMAQSLGIALSPEASGPSAGGGGAQTLRVPAQSFELGAGEPGFAFDNELAPRQVELPAFEIDAHSVSWARFLAFVETGSYEQGHWWSEAGRDWLARQATRLPRYLRMNPQGRWERQLSGQWCALDPAAAAVHLTAFEAEAWCRWAGRRLPGEAEWECAALTAPGFAWGQVWEWTASAFGPYPGFVAHPYRDYSQPWFGSRRVLRGACAATSPALAHPRYRNFFEPHRNDVYAGFRSCAGTAAGDRV